MNTTTNTTQASRYFAPAGRYFAPEGRYFAPAGRYFAPAARIPCPQAGLIASMPSANGPARLAGSAPGLARPDIGWLRRP